MQYTHVLLVYMGGVERVKIMYSYVLLSFQQEALLLMYIINLTAEFIQNFLASMYLVAFVHFACTEVSYYLS